jgi:diguanylate cyclase (GGDEF)-like protein
LTSAQALLLIVAVAGLVALALAAVYWRTRRARRRARTVTIDLRVPERRPEPSDPVTGLVHRSYFHLTLAQRMATARRRLQPLSLVLFELDGFDRARPEIRDQGLRLLSGLLRRTLREADTACRYGETSIAALLEDTPESGAAVATERIRRSMTASPVTRAFTLSAGIASYPTHALDAPDLLRLSVEALASARARGRDQVEIAGADS